ncbi:MAG: DUF2188 domain-containing protein [Holophagaceae bacterium]|uniref:DUF2188 domain-containing protein n=1 Tax=Candidatus Geothrix odensensis TaxID=2954440 RepID=A0A936F183_9BACT|nr:DUF2188 domain-containing protein [Candidatus Geothrix odensensis]
MNEHFWAVWIEDGGKPNQPYASHEAALARAKSLAQQTRKRVFILEAIEVVSAQVPDAPVTFDIAEVV